MRETEVESFESEHQSGLRVRFDRVEENLWRVDAVWAPKDMHHRMTERILQGMVTDVECGGDALVEEAILTKT